MLSISVKSILLPIVAGLGLFIIEIAKPLEAYNKNIHMGLLTNPNVMYNIMSSENTDIKDGIFEYHITLAKLTDTVNKTELDKSKSEDFIQYFIIKLIEKENKSHWDLDKEMESWFLGNQSSLIVQNHDAEENPKEINAGELKYFSGKNEFLNKIDNKTKFYLPQGSNFSLSQNNDCKINIETERIALVISVEGITQMLLNASASKDAAIIKSKISENDARNLFVIGANIKYEITINRFYRWSPRTHKELKWAKKMMDSIEEAISWEKFLENLK